MYQETSAAFLLAKGAIFNGFCELRRHDNSADRRNLSHLSDFCSLFTSSNIFPFGMSKGYKDLTTRLKELYNQMSSSLKNNDPASAIDSLKKGYDELERETKIAKQMFEEAARSAQAYADELSRKAEQIRKSQMQEGEQEEEEGQKRLEAPERSQEEEDGDVDLDVSPREEEDLLEKKKVDSKEEEEEEDPPSRPPPAYN